MGKHSEELKITLERRVAARKVDRLGAIELLRRGLARAIDQYGNEITEIKALADGELTPHEKNKVTTLESWIRIERERLQDLSELGEDKGSIR